MSLFNIDWSTQVNNLLPSEYRSNTVKKFIRALIEPVNTKSIEWDAFDTDVRKRAKFNGQILVLASALNNIYNINVAPFIRIETVVGQATTKFIYNQAENNTEFIYNQAEFQTLYFYNSTEVVTEIVDFKVLIPSTIYTSELEDRVRAEVNNYKLAGKRFTIEQYTP